MESGLEEHSSVLSCHPCYCSVQLIGKHIGTTGSNQNKGDQLRVPKRRKWITIDESDESGFTMSR